MIFFPFLTSNTWAEKPGLSTAFCKSKVFFDSHSSCSSGHRILEYTAKISSSFIFGKFCDIGSTDNDLSGIYRPGTCNCIQHSRFSGAVSSDDCNKITFVQMKIHAV
jgi:hypothetical protein